MGETRDMLRGGAYSRSRVLQTPFFAPQHWRTHSTVAEPPQVPAYDGGLELPAFCLHAAAARELARRRKYPGRGAEADSLREVYRPYEEARRPLAQRHAGAEGGSGGHVRGGRLGAHPEAFSGDAQSLRALRGKSLRDSWPRGSRAVRSPRRGSKVRDSNPIVKGTATQP